MTDEELKSIEARANVATPGPWKAEPAADDFSDGEKHCAGIFEPNGFDEIVTTDGGVYGPLMPDAEFIAHAREDIPKLIAEVRRLKAELEETQYEHACDLGMVKEPDQAIEARLKAKADRNR